MNTRRTTRVPTSPRNAYNGGYPIAENSSKKLKSVALNQYLRIPNKFPANKDTVAALLPLSNPPEEKPHATRAAKQAVAVADREKHEDDTDLEDEDSMTSPKAKPQVKRVAGKTANKPKAPESQSKPSPAPKVRVTKKATVVSSESENASEASPVSDSMRSAVSDRNRTLAEQALLSRQRALIANEVLDGTRKDLRIITEELKISQNTANILTKKCADQSNDLKTLQATLKGTERNLKKTEKELNGWKKEAEQLQQINEELEAELEAANSGDVGGKEDSYEIEDSTIKNIKVTVQKVFRMIKFVSTDAQLEKFGDMVMDNLGISQLKKPDGVVAPDAKALANVRRNRVAFRNTYCKFWNRYLNESRTTAQAALKKVMLQFSLENDNTSLLPNPDDLIDLIATRNCEGLYPNNDDTEEEAEKKAVKLEQSHAWIDFYTDKMVPAVAGVKLWGPSIRHLQPMTESFLPNQKGKLRITASTEAFVLTLYKNGWMKWKAMIDWRNHKDTKKLPYPKYNPKKPNENKQFSTPFSSGNCGQQKFGGWNAEGKDFYTVLQRKILDSRKANAARHLKEDKACVARLKLEYSSFYPDEEDGETNKRGKKRKATEVDEDGEEEEEDGGDLNEWLESIED